MTARSLVIALVALALSAGAALAGWTTDGATIKATTDNIPKIAAVNDGGKGTFVVWQEESSPGNGVMRAQHVLPSGDVDPAWPADGALLCSVVADRGAIGAIADHLGGAYVWWKEGASLYLVRFGAGGAVASGWPARGRALGTTWPATLHPSAIEDGAHGIYLAWAISVPLQSDPVWIQGIHLGPANTGAGGWPNAVRTISPADPVATADYWPKLALAPDGGIFLGWGSWSLDETQLASTFRIRRLNAAGLNAASWDPAGVALGVLPGQQLDSNPESALIDISSDAQGGVYVLLGLIGNDGSTDTLDKRLFRLAGDGSTTSGWPVDGLLVHHDFGGYVDLGADASLRVLPDGIGGVQVGYSLSGVENFAAFDIAGNGPDPVWSPTSGTRGGVRGDEVVPNGNGGVFFAHFYPKGPYQQYDPNAYLAVNQTHAPAGWTDFLETHDDIVVTFFGDIGLASSGDGGAIFYWSQVRDRFGLFARKFNGTGEVTGISPPIRVPAALEFESLRFVAGEGVRARVSIPDGQNASLELFDVSGRRVTSSQVAASQSGHAVTLAGTRTLASGLYFAKLATGSAAASGKVLVTR